MTLENAEKLKKVPCIFLIFSFKNDYFYKLFIKILYMWDFLSIFAA